MKVKPQFYIFHHEFLPYTKALRLMEKKQQPLAYPVFCMYLVIFNITAFLCLFIYSMFIF